MSGRGRHDRHILSEIQQTRTVQDQLSFVFDLFDGRVDKRAILLVCGQLRSQLCDGELARAYRRSFLNGNPIMVPERYQTLAGPIPFDQWIAISGDFDLSPRSERQFENTDFKTASGGSIRTHFLIMGYAKEEKLPEIQKNLQISSDEINYISLSKFMNESCLNICGHSISRNDFIKFMANQAGSVHFGGKSLPKELKIKYQALNSAINELPPINGYPVAYLATLGIIDSLRRSPEVQAFLSLKI